MNTLSINSFYWDKESRTFIADFTDLLANGLDPSQPFGRWTMHAPGRECELEMSKIDHDNEGDIMSWEFKPVAENLDFKVVIVND